MNWPNPVYASGCRDQMSNWNSFVYCFVCLFFFQLFVSHLIFNFPYSRCNSRSFRFLLFFTSKTLTRTITDSLDFLFSCKLHLCCPKFISENIKLKKKNRRKFEEIWWYFHKMSYYWLLFCFSLIILSVCFFFFCFKVFFAVCSTL